MHRLLVTGGHENPAAQAALIRTRDSRPSFMQSIRRATTLVLVGSFAPMTGVASGVSPYLPLNMAPEMERQIERVMLLADKPVLTRPIPAAAVLDVLPAACELDEQLCSRVRKYLDRYAERVALTEVTAEVALTSGSGVALPNQRGMQSDSAWKVSGAAHWQPNAYSLVSLGGIAHEDGGSPSGSMISLGYEYAQLDVGFREHWLSPFKYSAMLISTQAETMPSLTLSNYTPITNLGVRYQIFVAEMDHSNRIRFRDRFTEGHPRLAGLHLSIQPTPGWTLAGNRLMQFGGGERGGRTIEDFFNALWDPQGYDNILGGLGRDEEFGNQAAAWTSSFTFPGPKPFRAYLEFASEDRSYEGKLRFGNAALSVGIDLPQVWRGIDLTYEVSEWQNSWYTHTTYLDGRTADGHVVGHWGADYRRFGEGVGAQAHLLQLAWSPPIGGLFEVRLRTLDNEDYVSRTRTQYERHYDVAVSYARSLGGWMIGTEIMGGRDVFGDGFARVSAYARISDEWSYATGFEGATNRLRPAGAELFLDAGVNGNRVEIIVDEYLPRVHTHKEVAPHVGIGARRSVSKRGDLGVRAEFDRVNDRMLFSVRALDYRYRIGEHLALSAFLGAARYDLETPAFGFYGGLGMQWRDILPRIDVSLDARYADKVARDKMTPSDPPTFNRNDIFYDISSVALYASYKW